MDYLLHSQKREGKFAICITWMGPEGIKLNEISQRNENTIQYHLYVEYKKYKKLVDLTKRSRLREKKLVVTRGKGRLP